MNRPLVHDALVLVGLIVAADFLLVWTATGGQPFDARAYWLAAQGDPYAHSTVGGAEAYLYSPAFVQAVRPLAGLPFEVYLAVWRALLLLALAVLTGPFLLFALLLVPVASEINLGNVHLLLALVAVAGLRWPVLWSFALLTKVTPGVGLLWFAVRREWSKLAVALGATALIALASFLLAPGEWATWMGVLAANANAGTDPRVPVPFVVRFPAAVVLIAWGALGDRRWTVPVGAMLALPVLWYASLAMLVGVVPDVLERLRRRWPSLLRRSPLVRTMAS